MNQTQILTKLKYVAIDVPILSLTIFDEDIGRGRSILTLIIICATQTRELLHLEVSKDS